jgi:hypothetical protein
MTSGRDETYDLGEVSRVDAESVGEPGSRHFRLRAQGGQGTALLWLEKEQLYELAIAIKQLLEKAVPEVTDEPLSVPGDISTDYDFHVTRMALGQEQGGNYRLVANTTEDGSAVSLTLMEEQLDQLADQAFEVCASGRPRCPLCGAPLDGGEAHVCSRSNGHHKPV